MNRGRRRWAYRPGGVIIGLLLNLLGGVRSVNLEHLPRTGPVILIANHYTLADPLVAGYASAWRIGRFVAMVAKSQIRGWPVLGWLGLKAGVVYVRRGEVNRDAQRASLDVLEGGDCILIFPEGTRSSTGGLITARNGAALLALRTGAPIVPMAITGTEGMFSVRAIFGRRPRATVVIGQPFSFPHRPDGPIDRAELTDASTRMMREVAALLPPAQRGVYG